MARVLTTYFTIHSPWSYLGHAPLRRLAERHGATIAFKPMNIMDVFPESGGLPLAKRHPLRRAYRDVELQRWSAKRGVPFNLRPRFWPVNPALSDRIAIALNLRGQDPADYIDAAFRALWAEDRNLAEEATLAALLDAAGQAPQPILDLAKSQQAVDIYVANTQEALASGVFGAPTTLLDGEPFWGQDRLDLLDEALTSGRPALAMKEAQPRD